MRRVLVVGGMVAAVAGTAGVLIWTTRAPAQTAAVSGAATAMKITAPSVEARSGPGLTYYATDQLLQGDMVQVLEMNLPSAPGWAKIKPPSGAFSWVDRRYVKIIKGNIGAIDAPDERPVPVLAGSSLFKDQPSVEAAKLKRGAHVIITGVNPVPARDRTNWFSIQPTEQEVRYVPTAALGNGPATPLAAVGPGAPAAAVAGQLVSNPTAAKTTSLYTTPAAAAPAPSQALQGPRWSEWGWLRRTAIQKDGKPLYALTSPQGQPLAYAIAYGDLTLEGYRDRYVCLYGQPTYGSEYVRTPYITVTHVGRQ